MNVHDCCLPGGVTLPLPLPLHCFGRLLCRGYLQYLCDALAEGIKVQAYFAWSILDNFEWLEGYTQRFGLVHVAFGTPQLTRTIKDSGHYLARHFFRVGPSAQQHPQPH
jgi:hypothetical protein